MEFIPLERYSKNKKETKSIEKQKAVKKGKLRENESAEESITTKTKLKPRQKVIEKKNVKNKYRETLSLKKKTRVPKKKIQKKKKDEEEDEDDEDDDEEGMEKEQMDVEKEEGEEEQEDEESENEDEQEQNEDEEAYKRKCKEIDEKKKNRLFIKLKKKILNEAQVKELHPDIRSVIFPRKKNSRWCWAVFASEERADEAMKKLIKNKDVLVSKPTPYDIVGKKNKEKLKTILRKKEARKKVQNMWM